MTALMLATNKGHLGVVQDLIQGGADTNKQHPVRALYLLASVRMRKRGIR